MGSNLKIQKLHLLNVQVSELPPIPMFSMFNFISTSRTFPQFRTSIKTSLPINKLHSLSLSSSPAPLSLSENPLKEHSFEVSYLMNTFGFSSELAISRAKYLKFNTSEKPDNVLAVLKKHGFTKTQISSLVENCPLVLLLPRLGFLTAEIPSVITAAPNILSRSLKKAIIQSYNLLHNLLGSDDKTVEMIKRYRWFLTSDPEVDNIKILQEVGVPIVNIVVSMTYQRRGNTLTADAYRMMVEKVKEMGFDPSQMKFLHAVRAMRSISKSTREHKVQALKKYGLSYHNILLGFEKNPKFMMVSEEKIVGIMDFLVNRMGVEAATIANFPVIIEMSLKKRIVPRCLVYHVLLEKGLLKNKRKLSIISMLSFSKSQFLSRVIKRYENEVRELLNLYQEMLDKSYCSFAAPL